MLILYGTRRSGSAAVEMALKACALPYRVVRASSWEAKSAREELAQVNPLCQIPTLVLDDGTVLSESAAILIHLGLEHPDSGLLPTDPAGRARILRGLVFLAANCYSAIGIVDYPERWTTSGDREERERVRAGARSRLHHNWEVFAEVFTATPYLSGPAPGALDFLAVVVSRWSGTRSHLRRTCPELYAVIRRIDTHAGVAPVIRAHWNP